MKNARTVFVIAAIALLSSSPAMTQTRWVTNEKVDPMTDQTIRTAVLSVTPDTTTQSKEVSLVLKCNMKPKRKGGFKGRLEIFFNWGDVLDVQIMSGGMRYVTVQTRFDDDKASGEYTAPSNDNQATFVVDLFNAFNRSGKQKLFLAKLRRADQLIVRATAFADNLITATFDLSDLEEGASNVLEYCG